MEITGDSHAHLVSRLVALAATIGYPVCFTDDTGAADGTCSHREQTIRIAARLSGNACLATLIHEVAHALVRLTRTEHDQPLSYAQEELVVESIVFSSCQARKPKFASVLAWVTLSPTLDPAHTV